MASTQELLTAINGLQANVQGALPVLPNNGNPAGAYNMPQSVRQPAGVSSPAAGASTGTIVPPKHNYDWLKPSPYMDIVNNIIKQPAPQAAAQQPTAQATPGQQFGPVATAVRPILPQRMF